MGVSAVRICQQSLSLHHHKSAYIQRSLPGSDPDREYCDIAVSAYPLCPHIALSLNRSIEQAFAARNQRMRIVGPAEAQAILGAANLVEVYAQFVRDYRTSGLLNKGALHQVHDAFNVDAILSGSITSVVQLDGAPHRPAFTTLTLTYALIGLRNGVLLWDTAATVNTERTVFDKAPDVEEGIPQAQEIIITNLPTLP